MEAKNTIFSYMYRDGSNYKFHGEVVFEGLSDDVVERKIRGAMSGFDNKDFIASQVDIPEVFPFPERYGYNEQDDHCWHEFFGLEPTQMDVTDEKHRSISSLAEEFEKIGPDGWKEFDVDPATRSDMHP